jgi:hypothetical protein
MPCRDIFIAALKLLGERGEEYDNVDYADRAPYIIAAFAGEVFEIDKKYRLAHGLAPNEEIDRVYVSFEEDFPLSERFAVPCALYLASILVSDENPELSEDYYDRYCDSISTILSSLPSRSESIKNVY